MLSTQHKLFIGYFLLTILGLWFLNALLFSSQGTTTLTYRDFKTLLKAGKVSALLVGERSISGRMSTEGLEGLLPEDRIASIRQSNQGERPFTTVRLDDPTLIPELQAAGVQFQGQIENHWLGTLMSWILPALIFVVIWGVLIQRMGPAGGGLMSIGKSKAKVYAEKVTGVTFDDVAGIDEARAELMEIVDFLKRPEFYRRLGGKIPKGVLLVGAPGTGKTLLAKAVAGEAGVPFFSLSGSDFVEMFVGVGAARVRDLFAQAQAKAPSIIFIDELDALGKARGVSPMTGSHDEREQTLNQLLAEMDGFDTQKGVILLAATNRPEILDPALLRPGRFDRQVVIDRPDLKGRTKILQVHTRQVTLDANVTLEQIAARTPGFVGADLANLVNEAALHAAREGKEAVAMDDFEDALDRLVAGLERKSRVINPKEKAIVAYHEAGHALVAEARQHADRVAKISIIPRGVAALGYTQQQPTEDRYLMTRSELLDRLDVLLGGRTAEEIVFGDISTGAQDDLQRATDLVRHMITRYGMSDALGLATFEAPRQALFLDVSSGTQREYSEATAQSIDAEIRQFMDASHSRVRETLTAQQGYLEALGQLLISQEVVERTALLHLLETTEPALSSRPSQSPAQAQSATRRDIPSSAGA